VGRRTPLEHDSDSPRLVYLAPACVGRAIAVFLCESCGKPLNDHAVNRNVVELFARAGADAWFTPESDGILPAGTTCPHCGGTKFEKETDIFDVWLESAELPGAGRGGTGISVAVRPLSRGR